MAAPATTPLRMSGRDDRACPRRHVVDSGLITVELCPAGFGLLLNISEQGIGVYTLTQLRRGETVQVSFLPPGFGKRIECKGELMWAADTHAGLRLMKLDQTVQANLRNWLATLPVTQPVDDPVAQRREYPALESRLLAIEATLASERLAIDDGLQLLAERVLELAAGNGVAIAVSDGEQMICRASAGLAPEIGVHIDSSSGVTAECIRTATTITCEDTELDPRVDREVCRSLELRSFLIAPLLWQQKVVGVLEVFSNHPAKFGEDARWLANRVAALAAQLKRVPQGDAVSPHAPEPPSSCIQDSARDAASTAAPQEDAPPSESHHGRLAVGIVVPLLLAGALFWRSSFMPRAAVASAASRPTVTDATLQTNARPVAGFHEEARPSEAQPRKITAKKVRPSRSSRADSELIADDSVAPRAAAPLPESTELAREDRPADSAPVVTVTPITKLPMLLPVTTATPELRKAANWTGGELLHRVEPVYPRATLGQRVQGDVVLQARIARDGHVASVRRVKGNPALGSAAIAAVRQWRYQPFKRDDLPQEMDINITVRFHIPQ